MSAPVQAHDDEQPETDRRLTRLVRVTVAAGAAVLAVAAVLSLLGPRPDDLVLLGVVVLATLGIDATAIDVRIGHHVESYTWAEVVVVLGLALLAPEHLVLTALLVGVSCAATRRTPLKVLFNTASYALGLALGCVVTRAVQAPTWDEPIRSGLALAAGAVVFSLWNAASVNAAIAYSQGMAFLPTYRRNAGLRRLVMLGNIGLALVVLVVAHREPAVLVGAPVALGLAYAAYRAYTGVLQERELLRHLEASGQEMSALDQRQIADVAVRRAAALLQADEVELCLHAADGGLDRVHVGGVSGPVELRTETRQRADRFAVTTYRPLTDPSPGAEPEETCAVVPLMGRHDQIGVLRVRLPGPRAAQPPRAPAARHVRPDPRDQPGQRAALRLGARAGRPQRAGRSARPADRPAQPHAAAGARGGGGAPRLRGPAHRPRPLQAGQRHARARRRGPAARGAGAPAAAGHASGRHGQPARRRRVRSPADRPGGGRADGGPAGRPALAAGRARRPAGAGRGQHRDRRGARRRQQLRGPARSGPTARCTPPRPPAGATAGRAASSASPWTRERGPRSLRLPLPRPEEGPVVPLP